MTGLYFAISVAGPLIGVVLGSWLTQRQERRRWHHEGTQQQRAERRDVFARYVAAARTWQSNVMQPSIAIATGQDGIPYADAGEAFGQTIRALAEIRLVAAEPQTIQAAMAWERALRELSTTRAAAHPSPVPDPSLRQVTESEHAFILAARRALVQAT
jgi:hypothetical protein